MTASKLHSLENKLRREIKIIETSLGTEKEMHLRRYKVLDRCYHAITGHLFPLPDHYDPRRTYRHD